MTGKTHLKAGVGIWLVLAAFSIVAEPFSLLVGCLFPDTDKRGTLLGRFLPLWALGLKHRGITHTLWFALVISAAVWLIFGWYSGASFYIGYLSHIALDALTPAGRRKLWKWLRTR